MFITDPGSGFFPIPDPGVKKHRIPDLQYCILSYPILSYPTASIMYYTTCSLYLCRLSNLVRKPVPGNLSNLFL
jgi:hypothetical protein